jgi:hypothetical protein
MGAPAAMPSEPSTLLRLALSLSKGEGHVNPERSIGVSSRPGWGPAAT